jgi:hypothetical protein
MSYCNIMSYYYITEAMADTAGNGVSGTRSAVMGSTAFGGPKPWEGCYLARQVGPKLNPKP